MTVWPYFAILTAFVLVMLVRPIVRAKRDLAFALIIVIPVAAASLYNYLGNPQLPGKPYAERANDPDVAAASSIATLAAELEAWPNAAGYKRLAAALFILHRYAETADAYQKAIALDPGDAESRSGLGEAITMQNDDSVTPETLSIFHKALKIDRKEPRARFYIALAVAQGGNPKQAVAIWRDLEKDTPPDAPWLAMVKENIATYAKKGGFDPNSVAPEPPK